MPKQKNQVTVSSGNIYAEFGFANPELEEAKASFAREIRWVISERGLTQSEAGELLGIDQSDVSRITRGRLGGFSTDRLLTFLTRLNLDVDITIRRRTSDGALGQIYTHSEDPLSALAALPE